MKILVTGCAGFIGTNLCKRLVGLGHDVIGVDNFSFGYEKNMSSIGFTNYMAGDVRFFVEDMQDIDVVYHQANLRKNISSTYPERDVSITIIGTLNMLQWAIKNNVKKFIYASSSLAYGKSDETVNENSPLNPICIYGISKVAAENMVKYYHGNNGLQTTIFRYFQGYGYYQDNKRGSAIIPTVIRNLFCEEPVKIHGDGSQTRSFTWIDDIIDVLVQALIDNRMSGETYNVTSGITYSISEIVTIILKCYYDLYASIDRKKTGKIQYAKELHDDIKHLRGSNTKIKELGVEFNTDIYETIKKTIKFYESYNT